MAQTIAELARIAGVSKAAISHALNGTGRLSDATRQRLLGVIREQGYSPQPAYAALSGRRRPRTGAERWLRIAILYDNEDLEDIGPYLARYNALSGTYGYVAHPVPVLPDDTLASIRDRLLADGCVAVAIHALRRYNDCLVFDWGRLVVVACRWRIASCPYHQVHNNAYDGVILAHDMLRQRGCRRIGAVIYRHTITAVADDDERLSACLLRQHLAGADGIPPCLDLESADAWFSAHRPDGVVGFSDGIFWRLSRHHGTFAFASLHAGTDTGDQSERLQSGVVLRRQEHAEAVMRLVDSCVRHNQYGIPACPLDINVPHGWIWRS